MVGMLTLLLLVAAAALLVIGYLSEQPGLVWTALVLSVGAALTVLIPWVVGRLRTHRAAAGDTIEERPTLAPSEPALGAPEATTPEPSSGGSPDPEVVFVPGRLTFHDPGCATVAGKGTSAASRAQLEAGGMTACRRCLGTR
jgi:hypothetical protein